MDVLLKTIEEDAAHGLRAVMLFGVVHAEAKDAEASEAHNAGSHLHRAITEIKASFGDSIVVMTDVCLCTATDHGHCGLVHEGEVVNDASVDVLCKIAVSHALAGADYVCASDMMDAGLAIRSSSGCGSHQHRLALVFGEVRLVVLWPVPSCRSSSPEFATEPPIKWTRARAKKKRSSSQPRRIRGRRHHYGETSLPWTWLKIADTVVRPVAVYNVSGEYAMVMNTRTDDDNHRHGLEVLTAFKRAGASVIVTYHARGGEEECIAEGHQGPYEIRPVAHRGFVIFGRV